MLVLCREKDQSVMVGNDLEVMVLRVRGKRALITVYRALRERRLMWESSEPRWLEVSEQVALGEGISFHVVDIRGEVVRLGFSTPPTIKVHRKEVYDAIQRELRD